MLCVFALGFIILKKGITRRQRDVFINRKCRQNPYDVRVVSRAVSTEGCELSVKPTTTKECGASIACDFREVEMEKVKNNMMIFNRFILLKFTPKIRKNRD